MIIYCGDKETVEKQLGCEHVFSDVCMDVVSRFRKCEKCFVADRDVFSLEQYYQFIEAENEAKREEIKELHDEIDSLKEQLLRLDTGKEKIEKLKYHKGVIQ